MSYYERDSRVRAIEKRWWVKIEGFIATDRDGVNHKVTFEICTLCKGKGTHVNPSIDCGGISAEDFNNDPDLAEGYRDGLYDQPCNLCNGEKVIPTKEGCQHDYQKVRGCGVEVCNSCGDHKGLERCFCGWSRSSGDGRRELEEMGENVEEDY